MAEKTLVLRSMWKSNSANFVLTAFSEDEMRRPTLETQYLMVCKQFVRALTPRKEDRPTMDVSSQQPQMTAGLDLGDKYSYLCLLDTQSGETLEEGSCVPPPRP